MPEAPLTAEYERALKRVLEYSAQGAVRVAVRITPPAGRGARNPGMAVAALKRRIRADIPSADTLPTAIYMRGKAVRIENRGSYIHNLFVAPKGKAGRNARRHLTPAQQILDNPKFSKMGIPKGSRHGAEGAMYRFWQIPEPVWVKAADWNRARREHINHAGGLLAAWAPLVTALGIRIKMPSTQATATADMTVANDGGSATLKFASNLKPNGLPNFGKIRRILSNS